MSWLSWLLPSAPRVSRAWLHEQDRADDRAPFEGVSIQWPIKKLMNEHPLWNTYKLKKSA